MNKIKEISKLIYRYISKYLFLLVPLITGAIFLIICKVNSLYPFGNNTIAWCDMRQQFIPLISQFKDVLEGKQSFIYNLSNAGGMSLFSVYFFFLSSPFSLLVVFVEKSNLANFMNILVMFKLMMCSGTMCFYLKKNYANLNILINISLSLLYTYSIYNLMYYQNVMWLDIVYIFPLLILSLDYLLKKNKPLPYIILITLTVILNYYIAFMVICFVLFYMGLNFFFKRKENDIKIKIRTFIFASLIGALISCFSVIPSFIQYLESARGQSIIDSLNNSYFLTNYETTIPLLLGSIVVIPFIFQKNISIDRKNKYILLILLLIPIFIDPINKLWHLGSYQAFPCRFAFMLTFLVLDIVSINFVEVKEEKFSYKHIIGFAISLILIISLYVFEQNYIAKKIQDLDQYSTTLWGNTTSFEALLRYYLIIGGLVLIIFILYKTKLLNKKLVSINLINLTIVEILFSTSVYMIPPKNDTTTSQELYSLSEIIDDESFYRVKMNSKMTDINVLGGAGFNSLGHYTSLTSEDYMFTMKKLGYSSYWMEVGTHGGTSFTDALLLNKYTLQYGNNLNVKYTSENYHFTENKVFPFGIVTSSDLSSHQELKEDTRVNMQELMYDTLFNDNTNLHTTYPYSSISNLTIEEKDNRTIFTPNGTGLINYNISITGKQKLYFEAFDRYSNSLSEKINEKITVYCNGKYYSNYPNKNTNGSLYLGEFNNTNVNVQVRISSSINVSSFNLFSINEELLDYQINSSYKTEFEVNSSSIKGKITTDSEQYLFLPISYTDGLQVKINGKYAKCEKVFSTFVAIKLNKGVNDIKITYSQPGLISGISLSIIGLCLLVLFIFYKDKIKTSKVFNNILYYISLISISLLVVLIYVFPILLNISNQIK